MFVCKLRQSNNCLTLFKCEQEKVKRQDSPSAKHSHEFLQEFLIRHWRSILILHKKFKSFFFPYDKFYIRPSNYQPEIKMRDVSKNSFAQEILEDFRCLSFCVSRAKREVKMLV